MNNLKFINNNQVPCFLCNDLSCTDDELKLVKKYNLQICDSVKDSNSFVFGAKNGALCMYRPCDGVKNGIFFDWKKQWKYHMKQNYAIRKEPLAKALGLRGDRLFNVWDFTCGTGKDSLLILSFGAKISAFERNSAISLLIRDALRVAKSDSALDAVLESRFDFYSADVIDKQTVLPEKLPSVIYIDPMYPEKKKSAKSRKEMEFFKEIIGFDNDEKDLFKRASELVKRVVVKRPLHGGYICGKPGISFKGKSTRYDVYIF